MPALLGKENKATTY